MENSQPCLKAFCAKNSQIIVASHYMSTLVSFYWDLPTQQNHEWFMSCEDQS
jgi:hypothetical protein